VIRRYDEAPERELHTQGLVARKLVSDVDSDRLGVTHMKIDGSHPPVTLTESDAAYFVLEGEGWFKIGSDETAIIGPNDVAFVAAGTVFEYGGTMHFLNIQSPPFIQS
jgi:mannose-6-phosphate isomerase-like protein (cupin superfamily)